MVSAVDYIWRIPLAVPLSTQTYIYVIYRLGGPYREKL